MIEKRLLDGMQATVLARDAFDSRNRIALGLPGEHQTGEYAPTADMHGAGPALTMVAAFLCAEQGETLS
jgi:hypothetical protein